MLLGKRKQMTKNRAHSVLQYKFAKGERILIDANIWLSLFPAPSDSQRTSSVTYSAAFKAMLVAGVEMVVGSLILSEYLNRYCRIEYDVLHKKSYATYKKFRQSSDYALVGSKAAADAQQILKFCSRCDDSFAKADINRVLSDFAAGGIDFNDGLIVDCCNHNGFKLLTHDGDFTNGGIDILTDNKKLLAACP